MWHNTRLMVKFCYSYFQKNYSILCHLKKPTNQTKPFNWISQKTLKEYVLLDWRRCIRDNEITQLLQIPGRKRTWFNTLVGCRKEPDVDLCMELFELHYFLEQLAFVDTLPPLNNCRGAEKCLLYLFKSFNTFFLSVTWWTSISSLWFKVTEASLLPCYLKCL